LLFWPKKRKIKAAPGRDMKSIVIVLSLILFLPKCFASDQKKTCAPKETFGYSEPDSKKVNIQKLIELTEWINNNPLPVFSILISQNGKIFYELYTSKIQRNDAHYVMSVTKSVTSALAGVALDKGLLTGPDEPLTSAIPKTEFKDDEQLKKFKDITIREILGMSVLDVVLFPHQRTEEAKRRSVEFYNSSNRLKFALDQKLLAKPGEDFNYTDVTPILIAGALQYLTKKTLLDFAKESLFDPMGFENEEWMHQDAAGFDNGSYGLRLRPIDMQKFGLLYMNSGCWEGKQLISSQWVDTSFKPWIRSKPTNRDPDYGWYWWKDWFSNNWVGNIADGWLGQRIAIFPDKKIIVTMTAAINDGSEYKVFADLMNKFVIPALNLPSSKTSGSSKLNEKLHASINSVLNGRSRIMATTEYRLVPSSFQKDGHKAFKK
jgi:CubicO group peptidase (beta-lactamase class C family)